MAVKAPGRIERGFLFVGRRGKPHGRKPLMANVSMTSMIDVLVVLTVFLLVTFEASPSCGCIEKPIHVPISESTADLIDAPVVDVSASGEVIVNGIPVATRAEIGPGVARLDGLFNQLKAIHERAKQVRPNEEVTHVILAIDSDVPAGLVKSVVSTAAHSGYSQVDFMVVKRGG